jgi:hypothetical protein
VFGAGKPGNSLPLGAAPSLAAGEGGTSLSVPAAFNFGAAASSGSKLTGDAKSEESVSKPAALPGGFSFGAGMGTAAPKLVAVFGNGSVTSAPATSSSQTFAFGGTQSNPDALKPFSFNPDAPKPFSFNPAASKPVVNGEVGEPAGGSSVFAFGQPAAQSSTAGFAFGAGKDTSSAATKTFPFGGDTAGQPEKRRLDSGKLLTGFVVLFAAIAEVKLHCAR